MKITIITPTYNEAENLPKLVSAILALPLHLHILVVDDNSPDVTGRIADELAAQDKRVQVLHRPGKLGLRSAYLNAFQHVLQGDTDVIVQMDADFSHDPTVLMDMTECMACPAVSHPVFMGHSHRRARDTNGGWARESCDVVIGSRYVEGGSVDERWPLWRKQQISPFCWKR